MGVFQFQFQFQAKLIIAVLITAWLLVGDASEAYGQLRYGFERGLAASSDSRKKDGNGGIREDSYGGKSLGRDERKVLEEGLRFRRLRSKRRVPSPPPPPFRNRAKSAMIRFYHSPPPPSPPIP